MSLSVGYGTATSPPGTINFANATLSGLVFCQDSEVYKLQEYATGFDRIVRSFPYATSKVTLIYIYKCLETKFFESFTFRLV